MVKSKTTESLLGIDKNFIADSFKGLLIGALIIFLGKIFSFVGTVGIPLDLAIGLDDLGKYLVILILAPVVETIFFQQILLSFLDDKIEKNFNIKVPFFAAAILSAAIFSLFHILTYSSSLNSSNGSFISAFLIGILFCYEVRWFKSAAPTIFTHFILNLSIMISLLVVVG